MVVASFINWSVQGITSRSRGTGYAPAICALASPIVAQTAYTPPVPLTLR
jgi:hypothetical protein